MELYDFVFKGKVYEISQIKPLVSDWLEFSSTHSNGIVSNQPSDCDVYAPEINWYLKNSNAPYDIQAQNLKRMYYSRMNAFEYTSDWDFSLKVSPNILIIGENSQAYEFLDFIKNYKKILYEVGLLPLDKIISVSGNLGNFEAKIDAKGEERILHFSQAVMFYADSELAKFKGIEKADEYENPNSLLKVLDSRVGEYHYYNLIDYNESICQYHHRRADANNQGYCHKCVNVCPSFGVSKDNSLMELKFSALDCTECGECVVVCPSGAIDYDVFNAQSFNNALKHYKDTSILLIKEKDLEDFNLPSDLSPLVIKSEFLSEAHFLALLQESGNSCIFYAPNLSNSTQESIKLVNDIYQKIYGRIGIYIAKNISEIKKYSKNIEKLEFYTYTPSPNEYKRKHFSERLRFAIKSDSYGNVSSGETGELIRYGKIHVNESLCTLCLSCVGACNVKSLSSDSQNFSLRFNPSLCTTCGYCVASCPENAISLDLSGIELNPSWFENKIMAQDKPFHCIECGKNFATYKSIQKILSVMVPIFKNDPDKLKTLQCCPECKVKVMFNGYFEESK